MMKPAPQPVTQLLSAWNQGDEKALDQLIPLVYTELHRLAHHYMSLETPGHPLQTTALVNEAYLHLVDARQMDWHNRAHFFGVAAQVMRHLLVDLARSRHYQKRGGAGREVALDEALACSKEKDTDLEALDEALEALAAFDARKSRVVELRFFGGLSVEETAEVLGISPDTVTRDWKFAKVWLLEKMQATSVQTD
jgi:RNA polymerase sigma-70 factor (ECF subfamily)